MLHNCHAWACLSITDTDMSSLNIEQLLKACFGELGTAWLWLREQQSRSCWMICLEKYVVDAHWNEDWSAACLFRLT